MFSACVFDLDGTLLNTLQDLAAAGNHTLSALGLPPYPVPAYRKMVGNGIPKLVERMLPPQNRGEATCRLALELFDKYYSAHMQNFTAPYPGIVPLLDTLKQAGRHLGVVSNKPDTFTRRMVENYFPGIFTAITGLAEGMPPKPNPASTLFIVNALATNPATTLYIGDSDVDMETAHNAGLLCCGVLWGFRDEAELLKAGAVYTAGSPEILQRLILE